MLNFVNQLRGFNGVLAAFQALDQDICHDGCSLPAAVIKAQKRLKRMKEADSDNSSLHATTKQSLENKVSDIIERLESLPQDTSKPCQKTVDNCTIGAGCFASGALKLLDLITEPAAPNSL